MLLSKRTKGNLSLSLQKCRVPDGAFVCSPVVNDLTEEQRSKDVNKTGTCFYCIIAFHKVNMRALIFQFYLLPCGKDMYDSGMLLHHLRCISNDSVAVFLSSQGWQIKLMYCSDTRLPVSGTLQAM